MHGLEADYQGRIAFTFLDIDDARTADFKQALGYRGQPHYILLDANGKKLQQWFGVIQRQEIEAAFEAALTSADG